MDKALERKGSTLLELTIVMAILAIIFTLCISFSSLANRYTLSITTQETALSDFDEIQKIYETWVSSLDYAGSVIYIDEYSFNLAYSKANATTYTLQLLKANGELTFCGSIPANNGLKKKQILYEGMGRVTDIEFTWTKNSSSNEYILCLKVDYTYYDKRVKNDKNVVTNGTRYFLKELKAATVQGGSF